jgi:hypothetical protein
MVRVNLVSERSRRMSYLATVAREARRIMEWLYRETFAAAYRA